MNQRLTSQLPHLIRSNFPSIKYAFAYGSAVFRQKGNEPLGGVAINPDGSKHIENTPVDLKASRKLMVDMVFAVSDSYEWHKQNLLLNPEHYSLWMRIVGPKVISILQERYGAKIYYNTMVELRDHDHHKSPYLFKYGVIKAQDLIQDLNNWETLYVSGRLQKPTYHIDTSVAGSSLEILNQIRKAQEQNLENALFVALKIMLSSPELSNSLKSMDNSSFITIDLFKLFMNIAAISYQGDVRMKIKGAENKNKVENIVSTNYDHFVELYEPILQKNELVIKSSQSPENLQTLKIIELNSSQLKTILTKPLPKCVQEIMSSENVGIDEAIAKIVSRTSTWQTLKGIITAGLTKSFWYAFEKLKKGLRS